MRHGAEGVANRQTAGPGRVLTQQTITESVDVVTRHRVQPRTHQTSGGIQLQLQTLDLPLLSPQFGTPVDSLKLSGNLSRQLESGDTLSWLASINRDDADTAFPGAANPAGACRPQTGDRSCIR